MSARGTVFVLALALALAVAACSGGPPPPEPVDPADHERRVAEWRAWRHEQLADPDGWLSLIGLYWLQPGHRTLGAGPQADLRVTREDAPELLGAFEVAEDRVAFEPAAEVTVRAGEEPFAAGTVWSEDEGVETIDLSVGTLTWRVIARGDRLGVRVRDADSPLLRQFAGMQYYPLAPDWRLDGIFETHDPPRVIQVPNVLGTVGDVDSPGTAVFTVDGTEYRLDLWKDSDDPANFFTAFADETNGDTTYGGGRFLWIDAPDEHGHIEVDFNRAYNPPCAFTPYSTCPLPPRQNRVPLRIAAGELDFSKPAE